MEEKPAPRDAYLPSSDRRRLFRLLLGGSLALTATMVAGCAEESGYVDNRHPNFRHGRIERPGAQGRNN